MSGARFVRFYPSDWRSGCIGMSFEQEGFYVRVCAFIYEADRRLPLDDSLAAKLLTDGLVICVTSLELVNTIQTSRVKSAHWTLTLARFAGVVRLPVARVVT